MFKSKVNPVNIKRTVNQGCVLKISSFLYKLGLVLCVPQILGMLNNSNKHLGVDLTLKEKLSRMGTYSGRVV